MSESSARILRLIWTSLVSFALVTFGQPAWVPAFGPLAAVFGYALLWFGLMGLKRRGARFLFSSVWFASVQAVQLSWMTTDTLQGSYVWALWSLLSVALGLQFGLLSYFLCVSEKLTLLRMLALPSAWTLMEWLRLHFLIGFTWNPVGLALTTYTVPAQLVTVGGVLGLSFWVMLVNAFVFRALSASRLQPFARGRFSLAALILALVPYLYGSSHLLYHSGRDSGSLGVVLVQTGLGPDEINGYVFPQNRMPALDQWARIFLLIGRHPKEQIDLIVLPEGSLPFTSGARRYPAAEAKRLLEATLGSEAAELLEEGRWTSNGELCQLLASYLTCDVIAGFDVIDSEHECIYNAALLFRPKVGEGGFYAKRLLLPVAETIPFRWLEPIAKRYGITGSFAPGESSVVFDCTVPISPTICYEETFGYIGRECRRLGARALLNISTDGWYPHSKLPLQHFTHGRLRALENGVPLMRACHTGVTAAVDSLGRTVAQVGDSRGRPESLSDALFAWVPTYHYRTLYTLMGNGLPVGASIAILILYFLLQWRKKEN